MIRTLGPDSAREQYRLFVTALCALIIITQYNRSLCSHYHHPLQLLSVLSSLSTIITALCAAIIITH